VDWLEFQSESCAVVLDKRRKVSRVVASDWFENLARHIQSVPARFRVPAVSGCLVLLLPFLFPL